MQHVCVGDLMRSNVNTVAEATPLSEAAKLMYDQRVSSLVVNQEDDRDALGILTRKDIVEALSSDLPGSDTLLVKDVMTKPAIVVPPELAVAHCVRLMRMAGVRRVPVVKNGQLVGILSNSDLFHWLVENQLPASGA